MSRYLPSEQFGLGKLSPEDFGNRFVKDWNLELPAEDFLREFQSWSKRLLPGAFELLTLLRPRFRLAALSNSNALHWERNTNDLGLTGLFEVAISSHQVGLYKPDPQIYLTALDRLAAGHLEAGYRAIREVVALFGNRDEFQIGLETRQQAKPKPADEGERRPERYSRSLLPVSH